jgi:hypothetical protein
MKSEKSEENLLPQPKSTGETKDAEITMRLAGDSHYGFSAK